ncbi:microcystin-dependent protein [Marinimicrobium koreense]|uniref:Microcystin-dependent protein n=1 Tax=Marinimicrobium koreense TaxID=306545 RepID=A0A3N1P1Q5_9GAMM|nr:tail fiber protein [Marinimicrobium koreense]ROQ21518.1 microcystin-dependent protein [Marinimicrobium koreense]
MSEPFIGQIQMFGFDFPPRGWSLCQGQLIAISQNTALFSLIGTNFGGDGRTTFGLPDMASRAPVGQSRGHTPPGLTPFRIGQHGGAQTHTMIETELARHTHQATFTSGGGNTEVKATTDEGDATTPSQGAYLSKTKATGGPQDQDENIYKSNPSDDSLVSLGGVSGGASGTVQVEAAGGGQPFSIQNPFLALNFSIALQGIFPSRN